MPENQTQPMPAALRALLVILSILLCLCLFVSMVATTLVLDLRAITDKGGVEMIINSLITPHARPRPIPFTAALGGLALPEDFATDEMMGGLMESLKNQLGEDVPITEEQMNSFLEESTIKEFLTDKAAEYVSDFINGTDHAQITVDDVEKLIEENKDLLSSTFGVEITPEIQNTITDYVSGYMEQVDVGSVIKDQILGGLGDVTIPGYTPLFPGTSDGKEDADDTIGSVPTIGALMADFRMLTSTPVLIGCIVTCLVLMVALFFTNRMRFAGTLTCIGIPALIAGLLLMAATAVLQALPQLMGSGDLGMAAGAIAAAADVIAPIHYALAIGGAVVIIAAIVVASLRKKIQQ